MAKSVYLVSHPNQEGWSGPLAAFLSLDDAVKICKDMIGKPHKEDRYAVFAMPIGFRAGKYWLDNPPVWDGR